MNNNNKKFIRHKKYATKVLRERIVKMVNEGFSHQEIAEILGLNSRQLVRYHYKKAKGL